MKEQQTKYPWHLAPDWAMWAATDEDGVAAFFELEPFMCETVRIWLWAGCSKWVLTDSDIESSADWRNSLEKRPGT